MDGPQKARAAPGETVRGDPQNGLSGRRLEHQSTRPTGAGRTAAEFLARDFAGETLARLSVSVANVATRAESAPIAGLLVCLDAAASQIATIRQTLAGAA